MLTRRHLLRLAASAPLLPWACRPLAERAGPVVLNDIHSRLNATRVADIVRPTRLDELVDTVRAARRRAQALSIAGGRHAMGGQQFGTDTLHIDTRGMNRVLGLDSARGILHVEAGIEWPQLIRWCATRQRDAERVWGIRQKQTGADRLTLGGAVASNIHGRGLALEPIVGDIESVHLVDAFGEVRRCSRSENSELFALAVGGYGLFGVVSSVELRLAPRQKFQRLVEVRSIDGLIAAFEQRIASGFLYGDFQFKTDESAPDYLLTGVFSCYQPAPESMPIPRRQRRLPRRAWQRLLYLAHFDKARAYDEYVRYYLSTSGQTYWSDEHQLSYYLDGYHGRLDRRIDAAVPATEMISEVYVPRDRLTQFMHRAAEAFRRGGVNVIYGTVRLIEPDDVTLLRWARQRFACIVFNLHVEHSAAGIARAKAEFRALIDLAREYGGSFFLTYHRWATREQIEGCYPEMPDFLRSKLDWDPDERLQSDWYRHHKAMFAGEL